MMTKPADSPKKKKKALIHRVFTVHQSKYIYLIL